MRRIVGSGIAISSSTTRTVRCCKLRRDLEQMLGDAAKEATTNPLPIDIRKEKAEHFRELKASGATVTKKGSNQALDKLLNMVSGGVAWPDPTKKVSADDLPSFMKHATDPSQPLADSMGMEAPLPEEEMPDFLKKGKKTKSVSSKDDSPSQKQPQQKRDTSKLHSLSVPGGEEEEEPELEPIPVRRTETSVSRNRENVKAADILKNKNTEPFIKNDDSELPDFLKGDHPPKIPSGKSESKRRAPSSPQKNGEPKPEVTSDNNNNDDDLPDFLKANEGKRLSNEQPEDSDADLPEFLKPKTSKQSEAIEDDDDLPDFLKPQSASRQTPKKAALSAGEQMQDSDDLPDFLKPQQTSSTRQSEPASTAQDNDSDLPDFLKPQQNDSQSPERIDNSDDDLPDFLKPQSNSTQVDSTKQPHQKTSERPVRPSADIPKQQSEANKSIDNSDDDLPDFLKPQQQSTSPPTKSIDNSDDDLPDFLKPQQQSTSPPKKSIDNSDDDLPDFLKPQSYSTQVDSTKQPQQKTSERPVRPSADIPKQQSEAKENIDNSDDDLPDFLKPQSNSSQQKTSVRPVRPSADIPKRQSEAKKSIDNSDDDLPDFLKPQSNSSQADSTKQPQQKTSERPVRPSVDIPKQQSEAKENIDNSDDDLPDFLKPQQQSTSPTKSIDNSDDDLPDFLKPQSNSSQQKTSERPVRPSADIPKQQSEAKENIDNSDDDLPDFLKPQSNSSQQKTSVRPVRPSVDIPKQQSGAKENIDNSDDDLPDFLKPQQQSTSPTKSIDNSDDDLPDFLKPQSNSSQQKTSERPVRPSADIPKQQSEAKENIDNSDDDLPDFLKPQSNSSQQKTSERPVRPSADIPKQQSEAKENIDNSDDDLPDFLKPQSNNNSSQAESAKQPQHRSEQENISDDLPDFLKPQTGNHSNKDDNNDDLPDFLKPSAGKSVPAELNTEELREESNHNSDDLADLPLPKSSSRPVRSATEPTEQDTLTRDDDDLPDFLKPSPSKDAKLPEFLKPKPKPKPVSDIDLGDELPDFLKPQSQRRDSQRDDPPEFIKNDPHKLPDFLQPPSDVIKTVKEQSEEKTEDKNLPDFLKGAGVPPREVPAAGSLFEEETDLPEFLQQGKAPPTDFGSTSSRDDKPFGEFGVQANPTIPPESKSTPPYTQKQDDSDSDLPEFLRGFSKNLERTEQKLPEFLREIEYKERRQPVRDQYSPPEYVKDYRYPLTTGLSTEKTSGIVVLDAITCEPKDGKSWEGVKGAISCHRGKVAFGVEILWGRLARVGWSAEGSSLTLGSDSKSFGYGGTAKKSHDDKYEDYGITYSAGDIVHCLIDFDAKEISFTVNGENQGVAYTIPPGIRNSSFTPHVLTKSARLRLFFGDQKQSPPDGMSLVTFIYFDVLYFCTATLIISLDL